MTANRLDGCRPPSTAPRSSTRGSSLTPAGLAVPARPVHPDRDRCSTSRTRATGLDLRLLGAGDHPTAALMGRATEELAARSGPGIGGLLNVTFGNAPELIIALFALGAGPARGRQGVADRLDPRQHPAGARAPRCSSAAWAASGSDSTATAASVQTSMLLLAAAALVMPAIFQLVDGGGLPARRRRDGLLRLDDRACSLALVAGVLIVTYVAGLFFSLKTHRDLFNPEYEDEETLGLVRAQVGRNAGDRRGRGGRDVRDPRRLDQRGVRVARAVRVLHRRRSSSRSSATPPSTGSRCSSPARTRWTCRSTSRSARAPRSPCS